MQVNLGNEVAVVTSNVSAPHATRRQVVNGVEVLRLRSVRLFYSDLTAAVEEPAIEGADVIHAHSQNSLFSVTLAERLKRRLGAKVAFHLMAVDAFKDHPNPLIRRLAPYYGRLCLKRALGTADLPLVRGRRDLEILKQKYGVNAEYLPDGVPKNYFTTERRDTTEFMERYRIRHEKFFLFIGRIHRLKGPHVLVQALKYLDKGIAAVFIGPDGGYLKRTLEVAEKEGVRDRVYVLGYVSEEDKIWAIDSAVTLVLPSIADYVEVYPMVISEAWARERPVIGTRVGGIPYRIEHGSNGLLVNPLDPKALADAMSTLVNDEVLARRMGEQGKSEVSTWEEIALRSIKLYERVLNKHS
ncbi:MAG: glycosyltransferase family 4 protein, partial [Candidatus Korarchaeum sp.]|nr:glycosyltransferase family 4 protein [Candidatus Korarchaeum sp.]